MTTQEHEAEQMPLVRTSTATSGAVPRADLPNQRQHNTLRSCSLTFETHQWGLVLNTISRLPKIQAVVFRSSRMERSQQSPKKRPSLFCLPSDHKYGSSLSDTVPANTKTHNVLRWLNDVPSLKYSRSTGTSNLRTATSHSSKVPHIATSILHIKSDLFFKGPYL